MKPRRRHKKRYTACSKCSCWSLRVEENGKVCRHTIGFGYVENYPPTHPFRNGPICKGSHEKVLPDIRVKK